jgi:hypothetical protein
MRQSVETIGIAAVVISLLLVAYEVRQANSIAVGTTSYEIVRDINEFNDLIITDANFANVLVKLQSREPELTVVEERQARAAAMRLLNIWVASETAYDNGLTTEAYFSLTREDVKAMGEELPGLLPHWRFALETRPEFIRFQVLQPLVNAVRRDQEL